MLTSRIPTSVTLFALFLTLLLGAASVAVATAAEEEESPLNASVLSGLELRNLGPALMSGRIADIVVAPDDPGTWYVWMWQNRITVVILGLLLQFFTLRGLEGRERLLR